MMEQLVLKVSLAQLDLLVLVEVPPVLPVRPEVMAQMALPALRV